MANCKMLQTSNPQFPPSEMMKPWKLVLISQLPEVVDFCCAIGKSPAARALFLQKLGIYHELNPVVDGGSDFLSYAVFIFPIKWGAKELF